MNFDTIKTYYSAYCANNGKCIDAVAKLAEQAGLKVMLGVYEFSLHKQEGCKSIAECESWTKVQVQSAIDQTKNFGTTIIGIVVGNEDMFDWQGNPWDDIQFRIKRDIQTVRDAGVSVPVTTAQRQPDWNRLSQSDPNKVLGAVQIIGANIFPYWGGSPEKINNTGPSVATLTQDTAAKLLAALKGKGVTGAIITEEGWPSCAGSDQSPTNISNESDYFSTWSNRPTPVFDSYYFMAYDLNSAPCDVSPQNDANNHFGLCAANGKTKDAGLKTCP